MPIFVEQDPPKPPERNKQSIGIRIVNETTGDDLSSSPRRIRDGDVLSIAVTGTNRDYRDTLCLLDVSLRAFVSGEENTLLLADDDEHILPAAIPGADGVKKELLREKVQIWTPSPRAGDDLRHDDLRHVVLSPGRHRVSADLYVVASDDPPVHASRNIYVEVDPKAAKGGAMPFRFQPVDRAMSPLCEINEEPAESNEWVLYYNRTNVLYEQTVGLMGSMAAKMAFYGHVCIEALLDWALLPYLERRDDSNLEELRKSGRSIGDGELRDLYDDRIQHAIALCGFSTKQEEFAIEMNRCRREMGGIMSSVLRQRMQ